ncbi:hypothetical protein PROFUN_00528 [Planoprotostelium fungivorum]|uniref:Uncharacterized protein n=1 Tax=Planoprotostelium fungivorum TaxID=1890364 RepID=A0A2P6N125_9EUKA|nr:hypothetical protein PROFUN_00528 [Planoprotostelium fungivorum]
MILMQENLCCLLIGPRKDFGNSDPDIAGAFVDSILIAEFDGFTSSTLNQYCRPN